MRFEILFRRYALLWMYPNETAESAGAARLPYCAKQFHRYRARDRAIFQRQEGISIVHYSPIM
jgi:hypothetical protein